MEPHDTSAVTRLWHPDVDFVTVGGSWQRGRKEFRENTALYRPASFKHGTSTATSTSVNFFRPDLALTHVGWRLDHRQSLIHRFQTT